MAKFGLLGMLRNPFDYCLSPMAHKLLCNKPKHYKKNQIPNLGLLGLVGHTNQQDTFLRTKWEQIEGPGRQTFAQRPLFFHETESSCSLTSPKQTRVHRPKADAHKSPPSRSFHSAIGIHSDHLKIHPGAVQNIKTTQLSLATLFHLFTRVVCLGVEFMVSVGRPEWRSDGGRKSLNSLCIPDASEPPRRDWFGILGNPNTVKNLPLTLIFVLFGGFRWYLVFIYSKVLFLCCFFFKFILPVRWRVSSLAIRLFFTRLFFLS